MPNINLLKSKMALAGDNQKSLANLLGVTTSAVNYKLNGNVRFSVDEISAIAKRYNLTNDEIVEIFMCEGD